MDARFFCENIEITIGGIGDPARRAEGLKSEGWPYQLYPRQGSNACPEELEWAERSESIVLLMKSYT